MWTISVAAVSMLGFVDTLQSVMPSHLNSPAQRKHHMITMHGLCHQPRCLSPNLHPCSWMQLVSRARVSCIYAIACRPQAAAVASPCAGWSSSAFCSLVCVQATLSKADKTTIASLQLCGMLAPRKASCIVLCRTRWPADKYDARVLAAALQQHGW